MSDTAQNIVLTAMVALGAFVILYACTAEALPKPSDPIQLARPPHAGKP